MEEGHDIGRILENGGGKDSGVSGSKRQQRSGGLGARLRDAGGRGEVGDREALLTSGGDGRDGRNLKTDGGWWRLYSERRRRFSGPLVTERCLLDEARCRRACGRVGFARWCSCATKWRRLAAEQGAPVAALLA